MRVRRRDRAGYTIGEMIGVVVIAGLLLAAVVPSVAQALRVRQAEMVLKNDLRNAALISEQAYLSDRAYPALADLRARGFQLSPAIAVDSHAVHGERVYLRLRHEPTGQRCVLDYSRSSPVARNRPDCYAGGQDRDTALAVTVEPPSAPASDTFAIRLPPETPTEENPLALVDPAVDDPADRSGAPGSSGSQDFTVTNRNSFTRTFRVRVASSDPATVPSPAGAPDRLTLLPGVATPVRISYTIADAARAGASAVIPLEVVDEGDERRRGTGRFTITTDLALLAPHVVLAGAGHRTEDAERSIDVSWSVTNRANAARVLRLALAATDPGHVEVVSVAGQGSLPFAAGETRAVTARLRLTAGSAGGARSIVTLQAADAEADGYSGSAALTLETRAVLAAPVITPPTRQSVDPGESFTLAWMVRNASNSSRTVLVTPSLEDAAHLEILGSTGTGAQQVERGQSHSVSVTYRVRQDALAGRSSDVALEAVDQGEPALRARATAAIKTNIRLADPVISPPDARTAKPDEEFTVTWVVRNSANAARVLVVDAAVPTSAELVLASVAGAEAVSFAPHESRAVTARYRVRSGSVAGAVTAVPLTVTDRGDSRYGARASFTFTTALAVESPVWVSVPASPMSWDEGEERLIGYTFRNQSNAPKAFCVEGNSDDPAILESVGAAPVCAIRVAPFDTARVALRMRARQPGSGVRTSVLVYDQDTPPHHAEAAFQNSVRATRPRAVWDAPAPVFLRKWATFDGSRSSSPVASPIVRYVWTWGLVMQQWDDAEARFVYTGTWGTARDEMSTPRVDRAYDFLGSFQVCLTVVDANNRSSDPNCQVVTTIRSTVARLAWRYRGWWTDLDWCIDVWWDNQCDREHGNARWEIDLRPSVGDVPIKQAYAVVSVKLHNTDDPDRPAQVSYTGNAGTTPAWGSYSFSRDEPAAVGRAQDGRWRVLSTGGTAAQGWPNEAGIADHPLVLNINLADATGVMDGGPHWTPDEVWITLHVQDAEDRWTSSSAYRDHDRAEWRRAYDTVVVAEAAPVVTVSVEPGDDGWSRATGVARSDVGRIVDTWWEITSENTMNASERQFYVIRRPEVEVSPGPCERIIVTFAARDDRGTVGRGSQSLVGVGGCTGGGVTPGTPIRER